MCSYNGRFGGVTLLHQPRCSISSIRTRTTAAYRGLLRPILDDRGGRQATVESVQEMPRAEYATHALFERVTCATARSFFGGIQYLM